MESGTLLSISLSLVSSDQMVSCVYSSLYIHPLRVRFPVLAALQHGCYPNTVSNSECKRPCGPSLLNLLSLQASQFLSSWKESD